MRIAASIVVLIIMLFVSLNYSWLVWKGEVQPVLATWLIFFVSTHLSFWTYWSSKKHNFISNIANTVDTIDITIVFLGILVLGKTINLNFNQFEIGCLVASGIVFIFWRLRGLHEFSNMSIQVIMTIAYFPTLYKLWYAPENSESFVMWTGVVITSLFSLVPAIMDRDKLAVIYASRAGVLATVIILLMIRIGFK